MKRFITVFLLVNLFFIGQRIEAQVQNVEKKSHPGNFFTIERKYTNSTIDGYNIYVPKSCTPQSKAFPMIVFLQGGLAVGGEVDVIYNWGLPKFLRDSSDLNSELNELLLNTFVIVMPHLSEGQFYNNENAIKEILDEVISKYNVDKNRIYLTGLSRGGHGTWGLASRMPDIFAAIAPIAGSPRGIEEYEALINIPIWTSHNTGDEVVSYDGTLETVQKIESLSEKKFHRTNTISEADYKNNDHIFTSRESKNHNAWTEIYNEVNFFKWLLRFQK